MSDPRSVGDRIEELLAGLQSGADRGSAEELVRLLVEMYGEGLDRITSALSRDEVLALAEDSLVEGLLLLHDLHPLDTRARIERALDRVRPYLGSHAGGVEFLGVDEAGVARLRLEGSCDGCASSTATVQMAIETAVRDAAPEPKLLQVGMAPPPGWGAPVPASGGTGWVGLPELGPPTGRPVALELGGLPVLVCSIRGTLYAYRDACAGCGSSLGGGELNGNLLTCQACGAQFNVRLAGRGVDADGHLDPLPLLSDSAGTRVAVPS
jgi:Fe-S cluster biogenesis protein NfuA/nitrite reductase/ring-hydroxylating ferredoxin subunit